MAKEDKIMVTEHILEVRHSAVGSFLDVRGYVADYIRGSKFLPHWKIDANVVNFLDNVGKVDKEGAFGGYKSFGYFNYNPPTKNLFQDRASAFLKIIIDNPHYKIPDVIRFGCRTKVFVPYGKDFESLNDAINKIYFSPSIKEIIPEKQTDLQIIIEYKEKGFDAR